MAELDRRGFLKLSVGSTAALGLLLSGFPRFEELFAAAVEEIPIIWLQTSTCTGCSVSVLNSLSPKIQNVLVDQVVPGKHISLRYHATVMAAAGDLAMKAMEDTAKKKGGYVLVVEGAIPTKDNGIYCEVGEKEGHGITGLEHLIRLGSDAMAVLALGTCAAYGGIPAAAPNPTGSKSVKDVFAEKGIKTPVINIPGCPPHPDWFVGTVATVLIGGLGAVEVDEVGRPLAFFGKLIHDNCPRRGHFDQGKFAKKLSEPYCLYELGCKGPVTHADCPIRLWNSGTSWCVGSNAPCIGCVESGFPDKVSPLYALVPLHAVTPPATYPPMGKEPSVVDLSPLAAAVGAAGISLTTMDECRIGWGRIKRIEGTDLIVEYQPLILESGQLELGGPEDKRVLWQVKGKGLMPHPGVGDFVSFHWGWACDMLTERQVQNLEQHTRYHLALANQTL